MQQKDFSNWGGGARTSTGGGATAPPLPHAGYAPALRPLLLKYVAERFCFTRDRYSDLLPPQGGHATKTRQTLYSAVFIFTYTYEMQICQLRNC